METMFKDPTRVPGDLGFDPLGLSVGQSKEGMERMQVRRIHAARSGVVGVGVLANTTPLSQKNHTGSMGKVERKP
jgi:hypothetical protein